MVSWIKYTNKDKLTGLTPLIRPEDENPKVTLNPTYAPKKQKKEIISNGT